MPDLPPVPPPPERKLSVDSEAIAILVDELTPTNVFQSYEILEAMDTTEYNALTDTQKDGVKILLSCGRVDLNVGKAGRVRLLNWFGAQSTTITNLAALLE